MRDPADIHLMLERMERDLAHWKKFGCCPPKAQHPEPTGSRHEIDQLHPKWDC